MSPAFDGIDLNVDNAFDAISPAPPVLSMFSPFLLSAPSDSFFF